MLTFQNTLYFNLAVKNMGYFVRKTWNMILELSVDDFLEDKASLFLGVWPLVVCP